MCGSVATAAIASTTFRLSWPATSPKMVCFRFSQVAAPTVTKNCEPLVPGPAVGHGQQVRTVEEELRVELVGELVPGSARAVPQRVAALDHEALDDPVEDRAVVERIRGDRAGGGVRPLALAGGEFDEVAHRLRGVERHQPDLDVTQAGLEDRVQLLGHGRLPSTSCRVASCHVCLWRDRSSHAPDHGPTCPGCPLRMPWITAPHALDHRSACPGCPPRMPDPDPTGMIPKRMER